MRKKTTKTKTVETLTHTDDKRPNIPTAELQPVMEDDDPIPVTYERNRDLDPQFVWRGKDEQDWSDLVVQAPPLFIQEKVHPKVLIDDLVRHSQSDNVRSRRSNSTCSRISTACRATTPRRSSTSTTPTGRTG